jgi:putative hydroxymethylpyrimidine transport system substrate-binding protein
MEARAVRRFGIACCVLLALAGCGEKVDVLRPKTQHQFQLMLDYFPNADHAPIYVAKARGYFKRVGLDLKIRQPSDPSVPLKEVAAGRVDLAISYEPEVMHARSQGLHVVSIGTLVRGPLTSIISLPKAKINGPKDLQGKTVGTAGIDYQHAYLQTILNKANVPISSVKEQNVGFNLVPALVSGKVDAILGGFWNYEAIDLAQRKKHPKVIRLQTVGVPNYDELVFVANKDALATNGPYLRRFMNAMREGAIELKRHPAQGVAALVGANRDLDPKLQAASVKATLPWFGPPPRKPYGYQDPAEWNRFAAWMRDNGLINSGGAGASTNAYLPGAGVP